MAKSLMSVFSSAGDRTADIPAAATTDTASPGVAGSVATAPATRSVMILGKTLRFKGDLSADEDILLLGQLQGSIKHTGAVTVGFGGAVRGDVRARVITVKGSVEGDLEATEAIIVSPNGAVTGDIVAPKVSIVEGATFNGVVRMPKEPGAGQHSPAQRRPAPRPGSDGVVSDGALDEFLSGG